MATLNLTCLASFKQHTGRENEISCKLQTEASSIGAWKELSQVIRSYNYMQNNLYFQTI